MSIINSITYERFNLCLVNSINVLKLATFPDSPYIAELTLLYIL